MVFSYLKLQHRVLVLDRHDVLVSALELVPEVLGGVHERFLNNSNDDNNTIIDNEGSGSQCHNRCDSVTLATTPLTSSGEDADRAVPVGRSFSSHSVSISTVWLMQSCSMNI